MRRTLVRLATATSIVLGTVAVSAGPAAAGRPQDSFNHDCRIENAQCNPSQHKGWDGELPPRRNVGG
jgi:hypothetical protein